MTDAKRQKKTLTIERTYDAPVEDLWELWTTKEGMEAWWGPEGFRIEVKALELKVGGRLDYDMIAVGKEQIEFMKAAGMPNSHATHSKFTEVVPNKRIRIASMIDFLPGVEPYENSATVEFLKQGHEVRMVITLEQLHSDEWTEMAKQGWESQLTKLPAVLAGWGK